MDKINNAIDSVLDEIESQKIKAYTPLIEIHNNERLRKFASDYGELKIYQSNGYDIKLSYNSEGFRYFQDFGDYCSVSEQFHVYNSKLVAKDYYKKEKGLFELIPNSSVEKIESGLEAAIKKVSEKWR